MNYEQIIATAKMPNDQCGIYFLIKQDVIIYVGQSINVPARVRGHFQFRSFDKYNWISCEKEVLNEVEAEMILRFRPETNKSIPVNRRFLTFKQVRSTRTGFPGVEWRKWDKYCNQYNPQTIEFLTSYYYDIHELLKCPEFKQIVSNGYGGNNYKSEASA